MGHPPQIASLAPQNGPSLIGPQEIRLVISFGPKVQGAPAYVASFGRVVRGARFEEREPWSFARYEQIEALYRHAPRVRISCAPPLTLAKTDDGPLWGPFFFLFQRGLALATALRRLVKYPKSVSEPALSITDRPWPSEGRI